ncbi:hypothetical protein Tco_0380981 [Tanacetum coccineum]
MNSFCPTKSAQSMLKSLERFLISVQELKVKNSLRYKMMMLLSPSSLTLATKGMFYMENVDYPELIWEDFAFQIDHRKEKKSRRETMPFLRFTKVIINHFLSQHKSLCKLKFQHYHTIKGEVIQDTPKPKSATSKFKLKGVQSLTPEEQEATDTMQALKESKKTNIRQPGTGGSSEGTGRIPGVPDESTVVPATSSEGSGTKQGVLDEEKSDEEEKKNNDGDADNEDEDDDHVSYSKDNDDEDAETESDEDEIYKYKIQVHKDMDVEMEEAETVKRENKEKDEMTDAAKADDEKTAEE